MGDTRDRGRRWLDSLQRSGDSLLGLAQSRFELFALELQEEKLRAVSVMVWLVVALALVVAGLLVAIGTLSFYLWDVGGYIGLIGLAFAALAAGAGIVLGVRRAIRNGPTPFAETVGEFRKDRECLRSDN